MTMASSSNDSIQALEAFVVNNDDLERLEALLGEFNLFEAVGVVNHELRHSDFLAFLLDAGKSHGLGDSFTKAFLQRALSSKVTEPAPVRPIDVALMDLSGLAVRREWRDVDILLADSRNRLVVVIENKILSAEHSDQLNRYLDLAAEHFRGHKVMGIFLTPRGDTASHIGYAPLSYDDICELVAQQAGNARTAEVAMALSQYVQMLRRNIVSDSEISDLCRRIYTQHGKAVDLISQHRTASLRSATEAFKLWVEDTKGLLLDDCDRTAVRFCPAAWDELPVLTAGTGWTHSNRLMLFQFEVKQQRLRLYLGPEPEEVQVKLCHDLLDSRCELVKSPDRRGKWRYVYHRSLASESGDDFGPAEMEEQLRGGWEAFVADDLPVLTELVCSLDWLRG